MEKSRLYWLYIDKQKLLDLGVEESKICTDISKYGLTQAPLTEEQAHSLIPKDSLYCSGCPFHDIIEQFPKQGNGYCHYLERGDGPHSCDLLWDSCKACGINEDPDEESLYSV